MIFVESYVFLAISTMFFNKVFLTRLALHTQSPSLRADSYISKSQTSGKCLRLHVGYNLLVWQEVYKFVCFFFYSIN